MEKNEPWLLPFLARVRVRPGMFIGDERAHTLRAYITGYQQAREDVGLVGIVESAALLIAAFESWLVDRTKERGPQGTAGWAELVWHRFDDSERNVRTFFRLFEEFLQSLGRTIDDVKMWTPAGCDLWPAPEKKT